MDEPSQSEDRKLSAMEHVKKRHEEKGFLYAWSRLHVLLLLLLLRGLRALPGVLLLLRQEGRVSVNSTLTVVSICDSE
ncbi:unnamed protein product [Miscanthus lutarioriparius]|uniref:Uncharacterized protein n=1 Tax=Miscanthus lutarioriparius TaxID=422564 RepID=A0A811PWD1_9POAL|nr:unnamed protein product [Miscanthus lutarioriparius]